MCGERHATGSPADILFLNRLVSRGSLASKASDFGGLEVFGGASIGHTDPFAVISALDRQMQEVEGFLVP